jgi:hypothetical protein
VNNGESISFWLDRWTRDKPLCLKFPVLYDLTLNQGCTVRNIARERVGCTFQYKPPYYNKAAVVYVSCPSQ